MYFIRSSRRSRRLFAFSFNHVDCFCLSLRLFLTEWEITLKATILSSKGVLRPHEKYPYWPLRPSREEAWKRAIAFYPKNSKPPPAAFIGLQIVFFPDGVCSLWPDILSVEPGEPPYRFRLNDTLYLKLVTPYLDPLYTVHMDVEC